MENLLKRVVGILLRPDETWAEIKEEQTTMYQIVGEYAAVLAAGPAIAGFLGSIFSGSNFFVSLLWGVLYYAFSLAGVWSITKVLNFLATNLNIEHDEVTILKLVAYSYTAFFISGIFFIIPPLYWLSVGGLYGFYLFYAGVFHLLECSKEEKLDFAVISMFAVALILILVFALAGIISGINVSYLKI